MCPKLFCCKTKCNLLKNQVSRYSYNQRHSIIGSDTVFVTGLWETMGRMGIHGQKLSPYGTKTAKSRRIHAKTESNSMLMG